MSNETIFSQSQTTENSNNDAAANASNVQVNDPYANLLGSIKNERGEPKYKDVQTALDALKHSQEFIPQVKTENEKLKQEMETLRAQLTQIEELKNTVQQLTSERNITQPTSAPAISPEAIASLIDQALTQKESLAIQKANTTLVVDQIAQAFGKEAETVFYTKAKELGISPTDINALAAKAPEAVLQLFGLKQKQNQSANTGANTQSSINTTGYQPQNNSFIGRNNKPVSIGATTQDLLSEQENARNLVNELHEQGLTTYDLTDPKKYFKHFA